MDDKNHHIVTIGDPTTPKMVTMFTSDEAKPNNHHPREEEEDDEDDFPNSAEFAEKVKNILTDGDFDVDPEYLLNRHNLFTQMDVLCSFPGGVYGWKELSRWLKYEEKVDAGGRWSKPHVSTVSLRALHQLKFQLEYDKIYLLLSYNTKSLTWDELKGKIVLSVSSYFGLNTGATNQLLDILNSPHKHKERQADSKNKQVVKQDRSSSMRRKSFVKREGKDLWETYTAYPKNITPGNLEKYQPNKKLKQKLPPDTEAANVMVGVVEFTSRPITFLCRFDPPIIIGDASEVDLPTRFLFVALGVTSQSSLWQMCELGRATALLLTDKIFCEVAFKATGKDDLLAGLEEFLDDLTILPPSLWDPTIRLDPPPVAMTLERIGQRLQQSGRNAAKVETLTTEVLQSDEGLRGTNKIFGGLKNDIKRRYPKMASDIKDAFSMQCLASIIFLYFACVTPIVTFGGLMASKTDGYMGTIEMLIAGAFCGTTYAMFSGQPLTIVGATGPLLVFETIIYEICSNYSVPFLPFRFWMGVWIFVVMMIMVAFEMSSVVKYITRFTEESFAVLISVIFIYESISKLFDIFHDNPIHTNTIYETMDFNCHCYLNSTDRYADVNISRLWNTSVTSLSDPCWLRDGSIEVNRKCMSENTCSSLEGLMVGEGCVPPVTQSVPDVFLLSSVLLFGTFAFAIALRSFKSTKYFPTLVRSTVADFAVFISLVTWTGIDYLLGLKTSKLDVPSTFQPTRDDRSWLVNPLLCDPWWMGLVAIIPSLLATILLFLDQQITAVIVNRKENKLEKGHGYHLDLMVLSLQILFCSFFGLPWFCAATVRSISHVKSLIRESEVNAPGEAPKMLGIREQRVTGFVIHLLIGLSTLGAVLLKFVPMPVLYGIFLYMGITSLNDVQYIERIQILFMPVKYQPDYTYLRHVQTTRVHMFTLIQVCCSVLMWTIKSFKVTSIGFPVMLVALVIIRKLMDYIFTQRNLYWLDNLLPESNIRKKEDQLRAIDFASQSSQRRRSTRVAENCFQATGKPTSD